MADYFFTVDFAIEMIEGVQKVADLRWIQKVADKNDEAIYPRFAL